MGEPIDIVVDVDILLLEKQDELYTREKVNEFIQHEIDEVTAIINKAESIKRNAKMTALKKAVETAFAFQDEAGIKQRMLDRAVECVRKSL